MSTAAHPLRPYIVLLGPRTAPRVRLHVMARSKAEAEAQHIDLRGFDADGLVERFQVRDIRCTDPEGSAEDHEFRFVRDWYGDPTIPNGTVDCSRWACRFCDAEGEELRDGSVVEVTA